MPEPLLHWPTRQGIVQVGPVGNSPISSRDIIYERSCILIDTTRDGTIPSTPQGGCFGRANLDTGSPDNRVLNVDSCAPERVQLIRADQGQTRPERPGSYETYGTHSRWHSGMRRRSGLRLERLRDVNCPGRTTVTLLLSVRRGRAVMPT